MSRQPLDRLASRSVEKPCPNPGLPGMCWVARSSHSNGYSQVFVNGRNRYGHHVAYEQLIGPVPEGLETDHLCRNRACWNPWHLDPVTHAVNLARSDSHHAKKTHCPRGHAYSDSNTYVSNGRRNCRSCRAAQSAARVARNKS